MIVYTLVFGFLAFLIFVRNNKKMFSPSFLLGAVYFLGMIFTTIISFLWNIDISFLTILLLLLSLVAFFAGEFLSNNLKIKKEKPIRTSVSERVYNLPFWFRLFMVFLTIISTFLYTRRLIEIASSFGYSGSNLMLFIRAGISDEDTHIGAVIVLLKYMTHAYSYVCFFILISNFFYGERKHFLVKNFLLIIPILASLISYYISTSRFNFIKFFVFAFVIVIYFLGKRYKFKWKTFCRTVLFAIIGIVAFFFLFKITGESRASFSSLNQAENKFLMYAGSPIVGLDTYIKAGMPRSSLFGEECFFGLRSLIGMFVKDFKSGEKFLDFFKIYNMESNVYTIVKSLIADFGIFGMVFLECLLGFICAFLFKKGISSNNSLWIIIYAYISFGIIYQLFTPYILSELFSQTFTFELLFIVIFYSFIKSLYSKRILPLKKDRKNLGIMSI